MPQNPWPGGHDALAPDADRDVVPVGEVAVDGGRAHRVVGGEVPQRLVGEDHPPAEGVVGGVALEHRDLVGGVAELEADREVKARGPPAETGDVHGRPSGCRNAGGSLRPSRNYFKPETSSLKQITGDGGRLRVPVAASFLNEGFQLGEYIKVFRTSGGPASPG